MSLALDNLTATESKWCLVLSGKHVPFWHAHKKTRNELHGNFTATCLLWIFAYLTSQEFELDWESYPLGDAYEQVVVPALSKLTRSQVKKSILCHCCSPAAVLKIQVDLWSFLCVTKMKKVFFRFGKWSIKVTFLQQNLFSEVVYNKILKWAGFSLIQSLGWNTYK